MHIRMIWWERLMTGVVHLTSTRLTEHWACLSRCSNCCLLPSFTPLFAVEIVRHVKGKQSARPRCQPPPHLLHLMLLSSACFALWFIANCFSVHLLFIIARCTQGLLKPPSKFRLCLHVYMARSLQGVRGDKKKQSSVMFFKVNQKVVLLRDIYIL